MYTSVRWLNDYLDPPATAEEQGELLTAAGFPLEESVPAEGGDVRQDFEMTSNRGDCVSHLGLAREIAAISGRTLKTPESTPVASGPGAAAQIRVENLEPTRCPLYTARIIRGVRVGPSPDWLRERLAARGDIPRNNIVDATNFVLFELGQPTHVFDLDTLRGGVIRIRMATGGERFLPIGDDAREIELTTDDLVIADGEHAVALAGVKGGGPTAVTASTSNILIEAATFDPVSVRTSSRRHQIASDSSYRYERGVHPGQVNPAADRLAALILELAGGELAEGVVAGGAPEPPSRTVSMRLARVPRILGVEIEAEQVIDGLRRLGFEVEREGGKIHCRVPIHRLDVDREIDLIEEVGRMFGTVNLPMTETIAITVAPPQPRELAKRAVSEALVGMGFVESVTHSLVADDAAQPFLMADQTLLRIEGDRAGAESVLRPSLLPSLLRVRQHNRHHGVSELRLFEMAATYRMEEHGHRETTVLGLLADAPDPNVGLRPLRGAVEELARVLIGHDATIDVEADDAAPWYAPGAVVRVRGEWLGRIGVIDPALVERFDLAVPCLAAELEVDRFLEHFPPDAEARALPTHPAIERDVSAIVDEAVTWAEIDETVRTLDLAMLEALEFVTVYRGRQIGAGRKSLTLRCRFRAADRTLTHDEVDPQMSRLMTSLGERFGAEIRA